MRAKDFITEYMNHSVEQREPPNETTPLEAAISRIDFMIQKNEAIDFDHALSIVANEIACDLELDPVNVSSRIKELYDS